MKVRCLQRREEMELQFRIGFLSVIQLYMMMLSTKYTIPQVWDKSMWMRGSSRCCTTTACHQGYFLQHTKHLMMLMWVACPHSLSNSITALCWFPGPVWARSYKAKMKKHYFPNDLLICHHLHLPLCCPKPGCFNHQTVCSLTPPRNVNSCETTHNPICFVTFKQ
jgi:hypothetical protein